MRILHRFIKDTSGATAIEYGLIAMAIGMALITTLPQLKSNLSALYTSVTSGIQSTVNGG